MNDKKTETANPPLRFAARGGVKTREGPAREGPARGGASSIKIANGILP